MANAVKETRAIVMDDSEKCLGAKSVLNKCEQSLGYIQDKYAQIASNDRYDYLLHSKQSCSSYDARGSSDSKIETYCVVGNLNAKDEITIWGDSHAQHWINPMDKIGKENNLKVNIIGTSSCLGAKVLIDKCDTRFESIKKSGVLDRSESIIVSTWHSRNMVAEGNYALIAFEKLEKLTNNENIYFLEDVPRSGNDGGPDCNVLRWTCKNDIQDALGKIKDNTAYLVRSGVVDKDRVIPVEDIFCDADYCYSNIGGIHVYRDRTAGVKNNLNNFNSHLTASFAYSLWPLLEQKLKDAGAIK
jgi:hypothetical protein